jgi:hypothetical protein
MLNDHWKVLYTIQVCYADWKSKMAATAGQINIEPYGKMFKCLLLIPGQFGFICPSGFREEAF